MKVFTGYNIHDNHLQVTTDRDLLNPEITHFEEWVSTHEFRYRRDRMQLYVRWLDQCKLFVKVTGGTAYIDFGYITWHSQTNEVHSYPDYEAQLREGTRTV